MSTRYKWQLDDSGEDGSFELKSSELVLKGLKGCSLIEDHVPFM